MNRAPSMTSARVNSQKKEMATSKNPVKAAGSCCYGACKGFQDFVLAGDFVSVAVAFVIGAAFKDLVTAFVEAFITPLIALISGDADLASMCFKVNDSNFCYGIFITAFISFVLICLVIYFFVVVPVNALIDRLYPNLRNVRECPFCMAIDVPAAATKCKYCTSTIVQTAAHIDSAEQIAEAAEETAVKRV